MNVATNGQARDILTWEDLSPRERENFDYRHGGRFFRYRGHAYDIGEFLRLEGGPLTDAGWQGGASDTLWSGVVIRLTDDAEGVVVGRYWE